MCLFVCLFFFYDRFSATTYLLRTKACENSERSTFAKKILGRVILDQKMAVESNKTGFKTIAVAQMCEKLTFIQKNTQNHQFFRIISAKFSTLDVYISIL